MISCKEATAFIARKEERKLSFKQRFQLWRHLAICSLCRLFARQNKILNKNIPNLPAHIEENLSAEEKKFIVDALSGIE